VSREEAYEQAAVCYRRAGYDLEAARCYRLAGAHRRAAEIYEAAGRHAEAAGSFADAGLPELGAWLLAHNAGLPAQARAMLARPVPADQAAADETRARLSPGSARGPELRRRLILARCEIAEGSPADVIRPVIDDVCTALADRAVRFDPVTEEWAVVLSEAAARYDQAALVFATAVRGGRYGAVQRWNAWSARVLDTEVVLPSATAVA
jgi:hypothetical protein